MLLSEETRMVLSFANISLLAFMIWAVARIYFTFKNKTDHHSESIKEHGEKIHELEHDNNEIKITQAKVETKLDSIEVGIVDIKAMLIRHIEKE